MFSVFSVLFLCNQVFGVLYSGPFKSDGSNLPPGAVTKNYSTSTPVTINATGSQNALNVVGTSNIASVLYVNKSTSRVGVGTTAPQTILDVSSAIPVTRLTSTTEWSGGVGSIGAFQFYTTDSSTPGGARVLSEIESYNDAGSSVPSGVLIFKTALGAGSGAVAAERMRITSAGKVGIGTNSPTTLLSVNGVASFGAGTSALPSIAAFGDLNTGAWFPAADTFAVSTSGGERLRVTSTGRLGLGNSLPLGRLDMGSSTDPFGANFISWSSGGTGNLFNIFPIRGAFGLAFGAGYRSSTTASDSYISSIDGSVSRSLISARAGDIRLYTDFASNVAAGSPITPTERMRITSMGNVGIGTILPHSSAILDVQSTTKGLRLPNMTAAQMYAIVSPAAGLMIWNTSSVNVSVYTGAAWANVKDL
jgi:hypothetical protein